MEHGTNSNHQVAASKEQLASSNRHHHDCHGHLHNDHRDLAARRFFVALPFHSNKRAMASGAAGGAPLAPREGSAAAASVAEPPAAPGAASHLVSGTDRVMCESFEMEKACPERQPWLAGDSSSRRAHHAPQSGDSGSA